MQYTPLIDERLLRVAAYCRVSSDSTDQQNSYASQIQTYTEYIGQRPDWELADIYAEA
jgi:DNA invertase Pin-like site-specific DNA recombinase